MIAFLRQRDQSVGPEDIKSSQQEFKDVLYDSKKDTLEEHKLNTMLNTVIREVGLQNSIDNFKENKVDGPFMLKVSLETISENELLSIPYFKTIKEELTFANDSLKQRPKSDFDEKRIEQFSSVLEALRGEVSILKIEDNGGGLTGNGDENDLDSDGTVAILSKSGGSKKSNSSGSYGKGGKTAHFTSNALTVFYESNREKKKLSLGHTIISTWKDSENVRRGDHLYAVCPKMDIDRKATPEWHQGSAPIPFNRTLKNKEKDIDGLTTCCVAPTIHDGWEYQVIFAIVTSHLHALMDPNFDYRIWVGDILVTPDKIHDLFLKVQYQDFFKGSNDPLKIHYYMALAKIEGKVKEETFNLDVKLKDNSQSSMKVTLEWGKSDQIEQLCKPKSGKRARDDLRNHFLLVNKGMILRTGLIFKASGGSNDWLKLTDYKSGYFGYVVVDETLGKFLRFCERPSHDSIQPSKLDERTRLTDIPTSSAFNRLINQLEGQINNFINDLERVEGNTTTLKLFSHSGKDEDEEKETPSKTLILIDSSTKKRRRKKEEETIPGEGANGRGDGTIPPPGPNPAPIPPVPGSGRATYDQYCIVSKNDPSKCSMKIVLEPQGTIRANDFTLYQVVENDGKIEPVDFLNDVIRVTVNGVQVNTRKTTKQLGGKSIHCNIINTSHDFDQTTFSDVELTKNIPAIIPILKLAL